MVLPLHVLEIMEVMDICRCHIIGVDNTAYPADCMEFISIVVHIQGGAVPPCRSLFPIIASHGASFASGILADFHRLGVDAEHILGPVHCRSDVSAYLFAKLHCELAALIVVASCDQVGKALSFLLLKTFEKVEINSTNELSI